MRSGAATLIHFSRVVAEATTPVDALAFLADAAVEVVGASAAIVARVQEDGSVAIAIAKNVDLVRLGAPPEDTLVTELGAWALAATRGAYGHVHSRAMIANGDLFGALVLLFAGDATPTPDGIELADALVDLAAITIAKSIQLERLKRSHEELSAAQATLVRSEKLRALGQMAAGVSHDLKNILNPLWLHLQVLERMGKKQKLEAVVETTGEMRQVLTRGLQTVERLRDYARQSPESRAELVDLNAVADEAMQIAKPRMASNANRPPLRLVKALGAPRELLGRTADVVSAVVNLVVNAVDAMTDGGTITVRTGGDAAVSWIEVADDGPGMTPEIEHKVFEPFFTTKGDEGTGLGLAMVFACMERHGGRVDLETAPGKGASFKLTFPLPVG
ncbi:MAG TPA: HAMP domain-containing sensor histidine kinase [Byssovorax sp.]